MGLGDVEGGAWVLSPGTGGFEWGHRGHAQHGCAAFVGPDPAGDPGGLGCLAEIDLGADHSHVAVVRLREQRRALVLRRDHLDLNRPAGAGWGGKSGRWSQRREQGEQGERGEGREGEGGI